MNTPFSTVLIVLRDTPTIVARSACVRFRRARSSRRRLCSSLCVTVSAQLEVSEFEHRGCDTERDRIVDRVTTDVRENGRRGIEQERRGHCDPEAKDHAGSIVALGGLDVHEGPNLAGGEKGACG